MVQTIFRPGLFANRVAVVTGGGSGIGLGIARTLGALGAKVAIGSRKPERLAAAKAVLAADGVDVLTVPVDIREVDQVALFADTILGELGAIDILVNNAGGQFPTAAETLTAKGWDAVIRNNLNGTFYMTHAVATKSMIPKKHGRIINIIANIARGFPGMVHTGAARAGVENLTKTLAVEWAQYDIQVNAVAPGIIRSSGVDQYPPELVEMSRQRTPAKRLGTVEEVAELVVYLATDAAKFVTGETWYIDGGAHLWGDMWTIPDHGESAAPIPGVR
ncbi:MAG TPA: SDR family oxidoreductase [Polyangiaceae bacterium]|nr:SDR family oxidoreductase [Polyangiaceae bacterium]